MIRAYSSGESSSGSYIEDLYSNGEEQEIETQMRNKVPYIAGTEQAINEQIDSFSCKPQADTHVLMNVFAKVTVAQLENI